MAMERWGRRRAMVMAAVLASLAAALAALGVARHSFLLLCLGCLGIGMHNAFVQQYRFAATEFVPPEQAARALSTVMRGRTTIVIAHRPATIELADRAVLLDRGVIAAVGDHQELLRTNDRYREVLAAMSAKDGE